MNQPQPLGVFPDMSNDDYHHGAGLSSSGLKRLRVSPFHFKAARDFVGPSKGTPQMLNGTLVHCALLEPHAWAQRYTVGPDVNKNSRKWLDFVADAECNGLTVVSEAQQEAAHAQAAALRAVPEVADLLAEGMPEVSAFWRDEETGVLCRCRPDWVSPTRHGKSCMLLDVKTAADASPSGFYRAVRGLGYHLQAAWYVDGYAQASGLPVEGFLFAVVESDYPYAAAAYALSDRTLDHARRVNRRLRALYAQCMERDVWPGYPEGVTVVDLSEWDMKAEQ